MKVAELGDDALKRIADRTRELMVKKLDRSVLSWMSQNSMRVSMLAQCTWLATREELERNEKNA
jgi:hypothetical protein